MDHPPPLPSALPLPDRGVLSIGGADRVAFLQGLLSNDVARVGPGRVVWAAFLTPQGKYLHDVIVADGGDALLLDCEAERRDDLLRRLRPYRLRSKVELTDATDRFAVAAVLGTAGLDALGLSCEPGAARPLDGGGIAMTDPRHAGLGARLILPRDAAGAVLAGFTPVGSAAWDDLRLELGVPDGSRDLPPDRSILLENGFDELHGVSWDKGCYMGQELTARTKYRALIRKRLVPVAVEGELPAPGTPVMTDDREAGEIRSGRGGRALALLRLDMLDQPLHCGGARLTPRIPDWMRITKAD